MATCLRVPDLAVSRLSPLGADPVSSPQSRLVRPALQILRCNPPANRLSGRVLRADRHALIDEVLHALGDSAYDHDQTVVGGKLGLNGEREHAAGAVQAEGLTDSPSRFMGDAGAYGY
jgi:hypothetical protein